MWSKRQQLVFITPLSSPSILSGTVWSQLFLFHSEDLEFHLSMYDNLYLHGFEDSEAVSERPSEPTMPLCCVVVFVLLPFWTAAECAVTLGRWLLLGELDESGGKGVHKSGCVHLREHHFKLHQVPTRSQFSSCPIIWSSHPSSACRRSRGRDREISGRHARVRARVSFTHLSVGLPSTHPRQRKPAASFHYIICNRARPAEPHTTSVNIELYSRRVGERADRCWYRQGRGGISR